MMESRRDRHMPTALHALDWTVIAVYFAGIVALGLWVARRVKGTDHYFLGKREFSVWLIIGQAFGVGTHAEMPVALAGAVCQSGYSALWYQWKNLFITPFYWILSPVFRRFRRTTIGEVYEDRYGSLMGAVYTIFALCYFTFNMGAMLKGAGKLVSVASGGSVTANDVVIVMTATFLLYSLVGGLVAAAYTDFVQSIFIFVLSFLLIPLGLAETGGFAGLRENLAPEMLSLVTPGNIGVFTIVMLTLNGLIGIVAQPHMIAVVGTGKDERSCRMGFTYGTFVKRFCTIGWALVGLIVVVMLASNGESLADPEDAFGYATRSLLFPGAIGLMIASVLAANMSTCSAFTVDGGALFTQNLYRRYLAKSRADSHYLAVGRLSGVTVTTLGVVFALYLDIVLEAFLFTETMATFLGISMFAAMSWRRANRHGALASVIVSAGVFFALTYSRHGTLLRWEADSFGYSMAGGFLALYIVSRLTTPEAPGKLAEFYGRLDTRSELDKTTDQERVVTETGHDLLVVHMLDPGLFKTGWNQFYARFRTDISGLVLACGVVVALIVFAKAILYLP